MAPAPTASPEEQGRQVFERACAACHSWRGSGRANALNAPPLNADCKTGAYSDSRLASLIRDGGRVMPALGSQVSEAEIQAVVAYLRVLGSTDDGLLTGW
jgi:mono/diheme cytochrome c family protein